MDKEPNNVEELEIVDVVMNDARLHAHMKRIPTLPSGAAQAQLALSITTTVDRRYASAGWERFTAEDILKAALELVERAKNA